jgi:hypothetical protein
MFKIFKKIFKHKHNYTKPIISQYSSFNCRNIVYECKCGDRKLFKDCRGFSMQFPIETTHFVTNKEIEKILNHEEHEIHFF